MFRNRILRALCILTLGVLLTMYSDNAPVVLVQLVGALFVLPGAVSLLALLRKNRTRQEALLYPVLGVGSIVFGALLIALPAEFVRAFMYVMAGVLVLAGTLQFAACLRMRSLGVRVAWGALVLPLLCFGCGIFVMARPLESAALPFILMGAAYIVYGLTECWAAWKMKQYEQTHPVEDAVEVVEITED